jgi:hypothetical protein
LKSTASSLKERFRNFVVSGDTLQVYREGRLVYSSDKDRVVPLLEYIDRHGADDGRSVIFDKIMGNAAALLAVKANAEEVYSPMGSRLGVDTLKKNNVKHHLKTIVPFIQKPDSEDMCFMEKLSVGKSPDEFYVAIKAIIK